MCSPRLLLLFVPRLDEELQIVNDALVNGREIRYTKSEMPDAATIDKSASIDHLTHGDFTFLSVIDRLVFAEVFVSIVDNGQSVHFTYLLPYFPEPSLAAIFRTSSSE